MSCKISVIIPVYNAEKYLEESVNSVISSSVFNELEVLLIDDGSKDNSGAICDRLSQNYENIRTFHIENGGVSNARNVALSQAKGEYITFCDADDYYINDILSVALKKLDEADSDLLFYEYLNENEDKSCSRVMYPFKNNTVLKEPCNSDFFRFMLSETRFNSLWNKIFKKEVITKNSILFNKEQRRGGDRDFVVRFLAACKTAFYIPEAGYFYRYVKTSIVNKPRTDHFDNIHTAYRLKVEMAPLFNVMPEELRAVLEPAIVKQIISRAFSSAEYDFKHFSVTMTRLFDNEELMGIVQRNDKIKFKNFAYKIIQRAILKKNLSACWTIIKTISVASKLVRKIK